MPASRVPVITIAAPTSSRASTLIASSTVIAGVTETTRAGLAFSSSATVFMASLLHGSHVGVVGASTPFGHYPFDVLLRVLDVAGLAVHAVRRVDLQPGRAAFVHELVYPCGTVARLRSRVNGKVDGGRNGGVLQAQVHRLVFLVVGVGDEHGG